MSNDVGANLRDAWQKLVELPTCASDEIKLREAVTILRLMGETIQANHLVGITGDNREEVLAQALTRLSELSPGDWTQAPEDRRPELLKLFVRSVGWARMRLFRSEARERRLKRSIKESNGNLRGRLKGASKRSRSPREAEEHFRKAKRNPAKLRPLLVTEAAMSTPNGVAHREYNDFISDFSGTKTDFDSLALGPIWGGPRVRETDAFPILAIQEFLSTGTRMVVLVPGPSVKLHDGMEAYSTDLYRRDWRGLSRLRTGHVLKSVTGAEFRDVPLAAPIKRIKGCPLNSSEIAHLLGIKDLKGSVFQLPEIVPTDLPQAFTPWARYAKGGPILGSFVVGPSEVAVLPLDRPELDEDSINHVMKVLASLNTRPKLVSFMADFNVRGRYKGNHFVPVVSGRRGKPFSLQPRLARFLHLAITLSRESVTGLVHQNAVRFKMLSDLHREEGKCGGTDQPRKMVTEIHMRFRDAMATFGVEPYDLFETGGRLLRLRFSDQFES